jgi:hypothetical protein
MNSRHASAQAYPTDLDFPPDAPPRPQASSAQYASPWLASPELTLRCYAAQPSECLSVLPPDDPAAPSCLTDLRTQLRARPPPENSPPGSPVERQAVAEVAEADPSAQAAESAEPEPAPPLPKPSRAHRSFPANSPPEPPAACAERDAAESRDRTSSEWCSGSPCCPVARPRPRQPAPGRGWPTTGIAAETSFPRGAQSSRCAPPPELPTYTHASSLRPPANSSRPASFRRSPG